MHQPLHHLVADAPRDDAVLLDRALDTVLPAMLRQGSVVAWVPAPVRTVPAETLIESLRPEEPLDISGSVGGQTAGTAIQPAAGSQTQMTTPAPATAPSTPAPAPPPPAPQ